MSVVCQLCVSGVLCQRCVSGVNGVSVVCKLCQWCFSGVSIVSVVCQLCQWCQWCVNLCQCCVNGVSDVGVRPREFEACSRIGLKYFVAFDGHLFIYTSLTSAS